MAVVQVPSSSTLPPPPPRLLVLLLWAAALVGPGAHADLPIHCLASSVVGQWDLSISSIDSSNTIECGHSTPDSNQDELRFAYRFDVDRSVRIDLSHPNIAVDVRTNEQGTWTMVFDEGLEVRLAGAVYFAKFFYTADPVVPDAYTSHCDRTGTGWVHADGKWGCFRASKPDRTGPMLNEQPMRKQQLQRRTEPDLSVRRRRSATDPDALFEFDLDLIRRVNRDPDSLWKAAVHASFLTKTNREIDAMVGRKRFAKPVVLASDRAPRDRSAGAVVARGVDWTAYDSPVADQGSCGSCYVFSSLAVFEARARIQSGDRTFPVLSVQDVLACSRYNEGCDGGYPFLMGKYAHEFGLVERACLPYEAATGQCAVEAPYCKRWFARSDYGYVGGYFGACSEQAMVDELDRHGPIVAAIDVPYSLMHYESGIYNGCPESTPYENGRWEPSDHAIVIVGYGTSVDGVPFWKVRNSWGTAYGESGYFRIVRGIDACSIESSAVMFNPM